MIRKQYERSQMGYFNNFILSHNGEDIIEEQLKPYKAKLAKSKYKNNCKLNVKWYDEQLYTIFVLRWS